MTIVAHPNFPDGLHISANEKLKNREDGTQKSSGIAQAIEEFGIAGRVWEAADVLVDYLASRDGVDPPCSILGTQEGPIPELTKRCIVELGSGTGYVGLKLSEMLVDLKVEDTLLVLTDLPDVCPLLERNLGALCTRSDAKSHSVSSGPSLKSILKVAPLSWGNYEEAASMVSGLCELSTGCRISHIVCSDLVYFPSLLAPLLRTLLHLTSPPLCSDENLPEIIIGYKVRSLPKETLFWAAFGLWFEYEPVYQRIKSDPDEESTKSGSGTWQLFGKSSEPEDTMFIFVARRRKESINWAVPCDDGDLLAGVGALGTTARKVDDYFERLLLMQLDFGD